MIAVDPRHSLQLLEAESSRLQAAIARLSADEWTHGSNCEGWQIADLVAHVVRNGWSFLVFADNALSGRDQPAFGQAVAHVQEEIKAGGAAKAAERLGRETDAFVTLAGRLADADFQKTANHTQGPRTLAWAYTQRLVEVAFHHWDLRRSLGDQSPLDDELARYLLGFMLNPAGSSIMMRAMAEGTPPETLRLKSTSDGSVWRVTAGPLGRRVEADAMGPAGVEVSAPAGWLALALYGRTAVDTPAFQVGGPPDAAQRFRTCFGG